MSRLAFNPMATIASSGKTKGEDAVLSRKTPKITDLLPTHIRSELTSKDMRMIMEANLLDSKTIDPRHKVVVRPDRIAPTKVELLVFKDNEVTKSQLVAVACLTINDIFEDEAIATGDALRIFLQAMVLALGSKVLVDASIKQLVAPGGITIEIKEIDQSDPTEIRDIYQDPDMLKCKDRLHLDDVDDADIVMRAYCGAILLLAGKQLTDASAKTWTERRVRGLSASMGTVIDAGKIISFNVETAHKVYQCLSLHTELKATMVRILMGSSAGGGVRGSMSGAMLNLLAWSEMNHIRMVQEYLFGRYPELLAMRQLQGSSLGVLKEAWEYLGTLPVAERPYAKLLYDAQQTKALQRERFILLTDAAYAIGRHLYQSLQYYQGTSGSSMSSAVKSSVESYLSSMEKTGRVIAEAAQYSTVDTRIIENLDASRKFYAEALSVVDDQMDNLVRE